MFSKPQAFLLRAGAAVVVVCGIAVSTTTQTEHVPDFGPEHEKSGADLKYYREVVTRVGNGENYYDVANERLRYWGFRVGSTFNWRLPTYAYVLGSLPSPQWIRAVLLILAGLGMLLTLVAEASELGLLAAPATVLLQVGVSAWALDGDAFLAQEVWAGILILVSVAAAGCAASSPRWRSVAVAAGLLALFFRELVLPYCLIAGVLAGWHGRRSEAAVWLSGIVLFALYLWWHAQQVAARLTPADRAGSQGILEWVQFGGLSFDIMATRMNAFLMNAPGWLVFLYLLLALIGLLSWRSEQGLLLSLTTLAYLFAFAVIGRSMNFNWGLMFAPLLPFGIVRAPGAMWELVAGLRGNQAAPVVE